MVMAGNVMVKKNVLEENDESWCKKAQLFAILSEVREEDQGEKDGTQL